MHIDFGFVLGHAPGGRWSLERAPFKLTADYLELMGRDGFETFRRCFADAMVRGPRGAPTAPVGMVHTRPRHNPIRCAVSDSQSESDRAS